MKIDLRENPGVLMPFLFSFVLFSVLYILVVNAPVLYIQYFSLIVLTQISKNLTFLKAEMKTDFSWSVIKGELINNLSQTPI